MPPRKSQKGCVGCGIETRYYRCPDCYRANECAAAFKRNSTPLGQKMLRAQSKAQGAILRGDLVRQPCEKCGSADPHRNHAHHDDYDKPLEVRWLCASCHMQHHAAIRRAQRAT